MDPEAVLKNIKTRRVVRNLTDQPVEREKLEKILEAGRWAPAGSNQRFVRFVAIQDPETLRLMRLVSPGMLQYPQAAFAAPFLFQPVFRKVYINVWPRGLPP